MWHKVLGGLGHRKSEVETGSLPQLAINPDLPPVRLHEHLGDIEPQPQTLGLARPPGPIVSLEQMGKILPPLRPELLGHLQIVQRQAGHLHSVAQKARVIDWGLPGRSISTILGP